MIWLSASVRVGPNPTFPSNEAATRLSTGYEPELLPPVVPAAWM